MSGLSILATFLEQRWYKAVSNMVFAVFITALSLALSNFLIAYLRHFGFQRNPEEKSIAISINAGDNTTLFF